MVLTNIRLRFINDWRHAWRWSSVRFLAAGAVVQTGVVTCPAPVAQHVPEWVWQVLSCFALACMLLAGFGRITTTETTHEPQPPPTA